MGVATANTITRRDDPALTSIARLLARFRAAFLAGSPLFHSASRGALGARHAREIGSAENDSAFSFLALRGDDDGEDARAAACFVYELLSPAPGAAQTSRASIRAARSARTARGNGIVTRERGSSSRGALKFTELAGKKTTSRVLLTSLIYAFWRTVEKWRGGRRRGRE